MLQLRIRLFGAPRILQDDVPLAISRNQVRALLLRPAADFEPAACSSLGLPFWPDMPEKRARRHLSQLLSLLRSTLPDPSILQTAPDHVALNPQPVYSHSTKFPALSRHRDTGRGCHRYRLVHRPRLH
jgi:DNA-binding SARP family transcriptional activator